MQTMLKEYYAVQGCDAATGRPTHETLRRLALGAIERDAWGAAV